MSNKNFLLFLSIALEIILITGCIFNACPHRKLKERICQKCGTFSRFNFFGKFIFFTGDGLSGICTLQSTCCSRFGCFYDVSCKNALECPLRKCVVNLFIPGFCFASNLCCSQSNFVKNLNFCKIAPLS